MTIKRALRRCVYVLLLGTLPLACVVTRAMPAHAQRISTVADSAVSERALLLESALCDIQRPSRIYMGGWAGLLSALLITQGTLIFTTGGDDEAHRAARTGYAIGAGMSALGLTLVLTGRQGASGCDRVRSLPAETPSDREARMRSAERALHLAARRARRQTAWWMHGVAVALGLGVGLGLGLGYRDNALRATAQGVGSFAFTELRIWTHPTQVIDYAQRYQL